jgi:hypothetical protein
MITRDENTTVDTLAIVEKYEVFVKYLYPAVQRSPKHHGVLRDTVIAEMFATVGDLYHAAKSKQLSRLYQVDARFATLRSYLRFLASPEIRVLSPKQHAHALRLLLEPGRMLGAWQKKLRGEKG